MNRGYTHIYTGNGKGKTTAALGLSLRALCSGKKVFFAQFMKADFTSEIKAQDFFPDLKIKQYGSGKFIFGTIEKIDMEKFENGFKEVKNEIESGYYDVIVLDEIITAAGTGFVEVDKIIELIKKKQKNVELILTGRNAPHSLIECADLVTEMKEIKHYYHQGIPAREGIDK
ncbi:cob(I)yrinic acid a,c-diamide adenosyltransferase [Candidatus Dependentiae bacterium]|nr:cob(I)yrinic acid a,c-diamide adenosyltransferase [Candidatus Dependentiae bacterium]